MKLAAREYVQVQVKHRLPAFRTVVDNQPERAIDLQFARDFSHREQQVAQQQIVVPIALPQSAGGTTSPEVFAVAAAPFELPTVDLPVSQCVPETQVAAE